MRDVGDRVVELRLGQRPARPVGEAVRLVERVAGDALHQLVVGNRIAIAEHHGGDLGVEHRMRDHLGAVPDDFDVLPRGVEHLEHLLVRHQLEERREIDALRPAHRSPPPRRRSPSARRTASGNRWFAQELGVDRDERVLRQPRAGRGQFLGGCDQSFAIAQRTSRQSDLEWHALTVNCICRYLSAAHARHQDELPGRGHRPDRHLDQGRPVAARERRAAARARSSSGRRARARRRRRSFRRI